MPEPLTDDQLELVKLKYMGKLARLIYMGEPYSTRRSIGIVTTVMRPVMTESKWLYRVYLDGGMSKWYIDNNEWTLELFGGES